MSLYVVLDNAHYTVKSGNADDLHNQLPAIRADIKAMMDSQSSEQKWAIRPGKWLIYHAYGKTTVIVLGGKEKVKKVRKEVREDTYPAPQYVLLVEVTKTTNNNWTSPDGFLIFSPMPGEEGEGPNGSGKVNLKYDGFVAAEYNNYDPPGLVGQPTYRLNWCNAQGIKQLTRVDQSITAYEDIGGDYDYTVLWNMNNTWTWDDIAYTTYWESVTPGPPPPAAVGYTWAIPTIYGGPGGGDFSDIRHLFYKIESPDKYHVAWIWPPECHQTLQEWQYINRETCVYRNVDQPDVDIAWGSIGAQSLPVAMGQLMCSNTWAKVFCTWNMIKTYWGSMYGNATFPLEDHCASPAFPYTSCPTVSPYYQEEIRSDYYRWYDSYTGVYLMSDTRPPDIFIAGLTRWSGGPLTVIDYMRIYEREAFNPSDYFLAAYVATLTPEQIEIFQGNEGLYPYKPPDYYTGLSYYEEGHTYADFGTAMVNCAGDEYAIFNTVIDPAGQFTTVSNNMTVEVSSSPQFMDYGIFTKLGTGITNGLVDPTKVKPLYAYAVTEWFTDHRNVIFGMVIDGKHFRTAGFSMDMNTDAITIPGAKLPAEFDSTGIQESVRIGVRTISSTVKTEAEYEDS